MAAGEVPGGGASGMAAAAQLLFAALVAGWLALGWRPLPVLEAWADDASGPGPKKVHEAPLWPGETFGIRYRHSVFGVAVEERMAPVPGGFAVVEVLSITDRIAAYYAFPQGRLKPMPGYFRLLPGAELTVGAPLRLRATPVGQRTLVVGRGCVPLTALGDVVELHWQPASLVRWLWSAARQTIAGKDVPWTCPVPAITTKTTTTA